MPIPAIAASHAGVWRADPDGKILAISRREALAHLAEAPHLLLNAPQTAARLGVAEPGGLDLLELWAFIHPARFLLPSPRGLAAELGLAAPPREAEVPAFLQQAASQLLAVVGRPDWAEAAGAAQSLSSLQRKDWAWAGLLLAELPPAIRQQPPAPLLQTLPEWAEPPPRPAPSRRQFSTAEVDAQLAKIAGPARPPRPSQQAYADALLPMVQPRASRDGPNLVVAEAGTGIGKTLGYLAPASLYAEATGGSVWLSTFTRALQRQLRAETERSLPELVADGRVVVRKGRENYLCLLNLEGALEGGFAGRHAIFAELVARWARFTRDGDMVGGDLPGWLPGLFRHGQALPALTDRRGECIHAACPHYRRCFIEKAIRASAAASIVIGNHALVMTTAAAQQRRGRAEQNHLQRVLFDEGHHLAAAADSAFAIPLTGRELVELRRWLLGPEQGQRRPARRRGLAPRLMDVTSHDDAADTALRAVLAAAEALPASGWLGRIAGDGGPLPSPLEQLLAAIRQHVLTESSDQARGYTLEAGVSPLPPAMPEAVEAAATALQQLGRAMLRLQARLGEIAASLPEWLDQPGLARIEAAIDGLALRAAQTDAWLQLLGRLGGSADADFVDWFALVRHEGRELDCGVLRHWLDPLVPFARHVLAPAHGVGVTSATLAEPLETAADGGHLPVAPQIFRAASPFDYGAQARIWIATDVNRRSTAALAHAYAMLIEAAGGGTLGLFTAIARLRAVHARIVDRLAANGLPLLAQHVDAIDTGTLVDLFRAEPKASLLGTDALRDGVDVPGESLRLLVFEGVPWSRPTILNSARKLAFGGSAYEDRLVRQRLAQAFGRLIRSESDRGGFVILGSAVPSRLLAAFPPATPVARLPLAEVAAQVRAFLGAARDCAGATPFLGQGSA